MNYPVISKYAIQFTGGLSLVYALLGITLAIFSISSLKHLETMDFNEAIIEQHLDKVPEKNKEDTTKMLSKIPEIVISLEFKAFYWSMITLGIIINVLLLYIGYQLLKSRHKYIWWFIGLMAFCIAYMYGAPMFVVSETVLALKFGAAWGIGNIGVSLLLYTHFWLWCPLLVSICAIVHYKSRNESLNQTGADDASPG